MGTLEIAMGYYGLKEVNGAASNPQLLELIQSELEWADDDSTIAWCALFGTHIFKKAGLYNLIPEKPYAARNWVALKDKDEVEVIWKDGDDIDDIVKNAKSGDIVIFWRGSKQGWKGHFAWYLNEYSYDTSKIRTFGGNQDNGALVRPYSKNRILIILRIKEQRCN